MAWPGLACGPLRAGLTILMVHQNGGLIPVHKIPRLAWACLAYMNNSIGNWNFIYIHTSFQLLDVNSFSRGLKVILSQLYINYSRSAVVYVRIIQIRYENFSLDFLFLDWRNIIQIQSKLFFAPTANNSKPNHTRIKTDQERRKTVCHCPLETLFKSLMFFSSLLYS